MPWYLVSHAPEEAQSQITVTSGEDLDSRDSRRQTSTTSFTPSSRDEGGVTPFIVGLCRRPLLRYRRSSPFLYIPQTSFFLRPPPPASSNSNSHSFPPRPSDTYRTTPARSQICILKKTPDTAYLSDPRFAARYSTPRNCYTYIRVHGHVGGVLPLQLLLLLLHLLRTGTYHQTRWQHRREICTRNHTGPDGQPEIRRNTK